ncbi:MAG: 1-acyl-sn-glycerol-3-phosphate acyltransferase [Treponema sp.]|nr:1-acyl-sn-glycerol-3-phosphate acyltransferase [Treponema sp.]
MFSFLKIALIVVGSFVGLFLCYAILPWFFYFPYSLFISMKKNYTVPSPIHNKILVSWYKYFCHLSRVKIISSGIDKIPADKHFLFISNHRSRYDNMVHSVALSPEYISFISKPENFKIPFARRYMKKGMYISIQRDNPRLAMAAIHTAIDYLKNGFFSIGVFPEGTRSKTGALGDYKAGCLKIAEKAEVPLVVAVTQGTQQIHKNWPFKKTNVYFDIIDIVPPERIKSEGTVAVCDYVSDITGKYLIENKKD